MKERYFKFKYFGVNHGNSPMPVGVDGVLVGAWADASDARSILDIGTGCGVIALMMAQRFIKAHITAIDIDEPAIEEAKGNFASSDWKDRLTAQCASLQEFATNTPIGQYDFIISNPPYFVSGVSDPGSARLKARHNASLPLEELSRLSSSLLRDGGELALILPCGDPERIFSDYALSCNLNLRRKVYVRGHRHALAKRVLMQWRKGECDTEISSEMILEESSGNPTAEYKNLCSDFYLKF